MTNAWLTHVRKTMGEHPGKTFTFILKRANKTYKRGGNKGDNKGGKKNKKKKNKKKSRKKKSTIKKSGKKKKRN